MGFVKFCDQGFEIGRNVGGRGPAFARWLRRGEAGNFVNGCFQNRKLVWVNLGDGIFRQAEGGELVAAVGRQTADKLLKIADYTVIAGDFAVNNDAELVWLPVFHGTDIFFEGVGVESVLAENKLDLVGGDLAAGLDGSFGHGISVTLEGVRSKEGIFRRRVNGLTIGQIYIKIGKSINHIWYKYVHSALN